MTLKGRVAAEIQSTDELVLTELMLGGAFKASLVMRSSCPSGAP